MKNTSNRTKAVPWTAILLVMAVVFPPFLTLTPKLTPAMLIPVTGQPETRTLFQRTQDALYGFFSGAVDDSPGRIESANRSILISGWYRAAGGEPSGQHIAITSNPDHSLNTFEARWVESAPYQYRRENGEDTLDFQVNPLGEITAAVLNGDQVYTRLNWTQTPALKMGLLGGGMLAAAALALYRLRHRPAKG